jgi:plasmid stabilization system protein ParE
MIGFSLDVRFFSSAMAFLLAFVLGLSHTPDARAQAPDAEAPIKVMPIGTVHLDNPGRDVNNPKVPDVLTPQKQRDLEALRDSLAQFQPTKMAIEVRRRHQGAIDSLYQAFRAGRLDTSFAVGDFVSTRSEQYQLGFRLAKRLGHERVWAVDHMVPMRMGKVFTYAKKNDPALAKALSEFSGGPLMTEIDRLLQEETLADLYRFLNRAETVERFRAPYTRMATAGAEQSYADSAYVGADVVAAYHKRNLRIFANIAAIAEPGDRIITIFGAGHMPYLRPLIEASPEIQFVDPLDYL